MTRARLSLTLTIVLLAAGGLGFAWHQHSLLVGTQAELARAREVIAQLARKPAAPQQEAIPAERPDPTPPTVSQPASADSGRRGRPNRFGRAMAEIYNDPEIAPLLLKQRKWAVAARYAPLLARLGLPSTQAEQLKALLAEKQFARTEAQAMACSQGLGRDETLAMASQADADSDVEIKALLGDGGFGQLQEFDRTYAQRTTVSSLAERLGYAGAPLPPTQQEQLIQILAANATPAPGRTGGDPTGEGGGRAGGALRPFGPGISDSELQSYLEAKAVSDAVALQQAGALLTPVQVTALEQMQQEEAEQVKLQALTMRRLRQARNAGGAGTGGGG